MNTFWSDVSQYQEEPINDSYPHPFFCFRTNSGDKEDTLAVENARRAKRMLEEGKLQGVFAYYFFWPGQANCDLHREILVKSALWKHSKLASMIDVEGAAGRIIGNHSKEINEEISRLRSWYDNPRRVFGYFNAVSDASLWTSIPGDLWFVTPNYTRSPGVLSPNVPQWMRDRMFAHQFTDIAATPPWSTEGTDLNWSHKSIPEILELLGLGEKNMGVVEDGASQLRNGYHNVRKPVNPGYLPPSFADENGPWPNDMWAATVNEVAWDGHKEDDSFADFPADANRTLVGLVMTLLARQKRMEAKLDTFLEGQK